MAAVTFRTYQTEDYLTGMSTYALEFTCACGVETYVASWELRQGELPRGKRGYAAVPYRQDCRGCGKMLLPNTQRRNAALESARKLGASWSDALTAIYGLAELPRGEFD